VRFAPQLLAFPLVRYTEHLPPSRSETFPYSERIFLHEGIPVAYFDTGGAGEPIVFVHGLGCNLTHFEHIAPPLVEKGYRTLGLDLPGFGISGKPHRAYTIRFLSSAIVRLLDHLGLPTANLCGHSLGGLVCADVALAWPQYVSRLVLMSSAGLFRVPLPFQWLARTIMRPGLLAQFLERNATRLVDRLFAESNERTERFKEQSLSRPGEEYVRDLGRVVAALKWDLTSYHLDDHVKRLSMPTLVIWGEKDRLLPLGAVPSWSRRLPQGQLEVIEQCGHMPMIERPAEVVARLLRFLAETAGHRIHVSAPTG
jgi:pimeloyl-ACP methyl ester carboxylesterase